MFGRTQSSIVLELQRLSTDRSHDVTDLLRKALLVATKLRLDDFKRWVNYELNGYYDKGCSVPLYRNATAQLQVRNPYHGMQPLIVADPDFARRLQQIKVRDPIGNIIHILENHDRRATDPIFPIPDNVRMLLMEHTHGLPPFCMISMGQLASIVDAVRTGVCEWSLKLEEEGILGQGMTFSAEERQKAASSMQIHIGQFQGVLGDVQNSTLTQNLEMTVSAGDFESLKGWLRSHGLSSADVDELQTAIESDPEPEGSNSFGPRVSGWIGKMVGKAANGAWQIGVAMAGTLLTKALAKYYGLE